MGSLFDATQNLISAGTELKTDINVCKGLMDTSANAAFKRQYVRAYFAYVECTIYGLKNILFRLHESGGLELGPGEASLLEERSWDLGDDGKPHAKQANISTKKNLRFLFHVLSREAPEHLSVDFSCSSWQMFLKSLLVRHRITHPKLNSDLEVLDKEIADMASASTWLDETFADALHAIAALIDAATSRVG